MTQFLSSKVARYLVSGGVAALVQFSSLYFFVEALSLWYLAATTAAFVLTFIVSFIMQKFWTFEERSMGSLHIQISGYLAFSLANMFVNAFSMYLLVSALNVHYMLAQFCTTALIAFYGFFVYKHLIFRAP